MPWQEVQKTILGLADYSRENHGCMPVWLPSADTGVAKRHDKPDFFTTRYAHLLKIGSFAVRGEEEARVSRTYVLLLDSFNAVGRAEGSENMISEIIEIISTSSSNI